MQVGRSENIVGWYHSHPGYGCWLSGIDVTTQLNNQMFQDPFLAIVIDPNRTISAGKVEIGAFRAYPEVRLCIEAARPTLTAKSRIELHATECSCLGISKHPTQQDRRFWCTLISLLPARDLALQIVTRYAAPRVAVEQILGDDTLAIASHHSELRQCG